MTSRPEEDAIPSGRTRGQRVLTAVEVEAKIDDLSDRMEDVLEDFEAREDRAAEAKHAYELAAAKVRLRASSQPGNGPGGRTTVDEREAMVIVECEEQLLEHLIADAKKAAAKKTLDVMSNRMDGLRTIAANIRGQT